VDYGYCTDTTVNASAALAHELKTLNLMFSPTDLIKFLGQNSGVFIDLGKDLGTIEPGKLADILVLGGNPFDGYWYFLDPEVVIKGGVIMVDNRGKPNAGKPIARAS
jgi:imidazolonepropionase-like amidohydrolase